MVTDLWTFICTISYNGKIQLWSIKSSNDDASDLNFCMACSTRQRCPQVWNGIPRTSSLNLCHPHERRDLWTDRRWMLGYMMSFADWLVTKAKKLAPVPSTGNQQWIPIQQEINVEFPSNRNSILNSYPTKGSYWIPIQLLVCFILMCYCTSCNSDNDSS